ncbi:hypothetical protein KY362_04355 [Candidatus Woesearchaeota archaeon]|nr:hypothetical protein [Candidatus Woesearchaeota archaeon]
MTELLCFGPLLWDIFGNEKKLGGAPFNAGAVAALLGVDTVVVTAVGDDALGEDILETAGKTKAAVIAQKNDKPTGTVQVTLDDEKKPRFDILKDVAYDYIEYDEVMEEEAKQAKYLMWEPLSVRGKISRSTLKKIWETTSALKIFDWNYREGIDDIEEICREGVEAADILKMNDEEAELLKKILPVPMEDPEVKQLATVFRMDEDAARNELYMRKLAAMHGLKYIIVTAGAKGAALFTVETGVYAPAIKVPVVDTTGCGDSVTAAVVQGLLKGMDEEHIIVNAVEVASKVAQNKGAVPEKL